MHEEVGNTYKILIRKNHSADIGIDWRAILEWISEE
jgi:hypothetical protein